MKLAGSIESSTEVMKTMSGLMRIPEMQRTMTNMSKEMMKMGIIEEMMEDTFDSVLEDVDEGKLQLDFLIFIFKCILIVFEIFCLGVVDEEVEKVLFEVTKGKLEGLPSVNTASLPAGATATVNTELDEDEPLEDMTRRLESLRS